MVEKILFLDIDGVLNGHEFNNKSDSCTIRPDCVEQLNRVIDTTGCLIVLSSAWRYMILNGAMTVGGFQYMMRTHGVTKNFKMIGTLPLDRTQTEDGLARGRAVIEWMMKYPNYSPLPIWAIVDDLELFETQPVNFVRTNKYVGLTVTDADKLIGILNHRDHQGSSQQSLQ